MGEPAPPVEIVERIDVSNEIGNRLPGVGQMRPEIQASISERFLRVLAPRFKNATVERGETHGSYLFAKRT